MKEKSIFEQASMPKLLMSLCIPSIIVMIVMVIYNMVDIFFIGQIGDPFQVAAIALSGSIYAVVQGIGTLIGAGSMISISIALGKGDWKNITAMTAFSFWLAIILGTVIFIFITIFINPIVYLLGGSIQTADFAENYIRWLSFGFPIMIATSVLSNVVRADGSIKVTMIGSMIGTITNILLDPLLILVVDMGVKGAAIATVVGISLNFIYLVIFVIWKSKHLSLNFKDIRWHRDTTYRLLIYGIPMASSTVLMSFSNMFLNKALVSYGDLVIAGAGISGKIGSLVGMVIIGITMGIQPAISYNYGAGNLIRLSKILTVTWYTTFITGIILSLLVIVIKNNLILFFIDNLEVKNYGQRFLTASMITGPVIGTYQLSTTYLQATGKVVPATLTSLLRKGIILLPIIFFMQLCFGLTGLIYANAVTDIISVVITLIIAYSNFK